MATVTGLPKSVIDTVEKLSTMYGFDKDEATKRMFALRLKNIPEEVVTRTAQMSLADKANALHEMYTQKQSEKQERADAAAAKRETADAEKAAKAQEKAQKDAEKLAVKQERAAKKEADDVAKAQRKQEREQKKVDDEAQKAAKAQEREQKKAAAEAKKAEIALKKQQREDAKIAKAAEKAQKDAEKEQKKHEREQKKLAAEQKKLEKENAVVAASELYTVPKYTPFCGVVYEGYCMGLRPAGGLFTQCNNHATHDGGFCSTCFKQAQKNPDNKPNNGVIQDRMAVGAFEFRNKKGQAPTPLIKVLEKVGVDRDAFEKTHAEFIASSGITADIPQENWEVKVAKRGRPKKSVTIQEPDNQTDDMVANVIVAEAQEEDEDDDETEVEKVEIDGKSYLKTEDGSLYNEDTMELVGTLNDQGGIDEVDDDEDDE